MLAFSNSCLLNQQSNTQRFRATLSGNTLKDFVIQVSNQRFVSKAQNPKCDHIPILCASQCSSLACMSRGQRVQPVLHFIILCMFMFQSVQLLVHFHVCFASAADCQAGYKWGESCHATQAKLVERERWSALQFCPTHHPGCFG